LRRGTGDIRIEDIALDGGPECAPGTVGEGGVLRLTARWRAVRPVPEAVVGVAIHSLEGFLCAETTSPSFEAGPGAGAEGRAGVEIPAIRLLPGDYSVTVYATDARRLVLYDRLEGLVPLKVSGAPRDGEAGVLSLDPRWTITRDGT
jgi:hypothetical protein